MRQIAGFAICAHLFDYEGRSPDKCTDTFVENNKVRFCYEKV